MIPPSGRTANPMPSVANDSSVPDSGSVRREEHVVEVQRGGRAEADEVVGLDRRADRAADRDPLLLGCALDRVPVGDVFQVRVGLWRLRLGHDDLRLARLKGCAGGSLHRTA